MLIGILIEESSPGAHRGTIWIDKNIEFLLVTLSFETIIC
jgi:hypothetical protein